MSYGLYKARLDDVAVTTAKTLVELTAPSSAVLEVVSVRVGSSAIASENSTVQFLRKSVAGTGTSFTPVPVAAGMPAAGATCRVNCTVEGTVSATVDDAQWNLVSGFEWAALSELSRIIVPPSGIFAVKLNTAPAASKDFAVVIEFIEKG